MTACAFFGGSEPAAVILACVVVIAVLVYVGVICYLIARD